MKYIETSSEKIVNGIFKCGILFIVSNLFILVSLNSNATSLLGHYLSIGILILGNVIKLISLIYILKFLSSALYKILNITENKK